MALWKLAKDVWRTGWAIVAVMILLGFFLWVAWV
jgi:hypothetical protein